MNQFLLGGAALSAWVAGLFFLRFWRLTRDRLFAFFTIGFWVLGLNWLVLAFADPSSESHHRVYFIRLVAFGFIIAGIVDKNRPSRGGQSSSGRAP